LITDSLQLDATFPDTYKSIESDYFRGDFLTLIYRNHSDTKLADAFNTAWSNSRKSQYEIEQFALPFTNVTALSTSQQKMYRRFISSEHYSFWKEKLSAILLTDTGIVYMLS
jgi:hypothetical protein